MNSTRRDQLRDIQEQLADIMSRIEELQEEEQTAYDNMPESFQDSERGEKAQNAIDTIGYLHDYVDSARATIEEFFEL